MTFADHELIRAIDRRLPQTQCESCGYKGCLAYSRAVANGDAEINQCPPGGEVTIGALARLLGRDALPLNPEYVAPPATQVARVIEEDCIGCKLCIHACPLDCIIGAAKLMHSVIAAECSGCELCLPVCPTDCIVMQPRGHELNEHDLNKFSGAKVWKEFTPAQTNKWRMRAAQKHARQLQDKKEKRARKIKNARRELQHEIAAAVRRKQNQKRNLQTPNMSCRPQ